MNTIAVISIATIVCAASPFKWKPWALAITGCAIYALILGLQSAVVISLAIFVSMVAHKLNSKIFCAGVIMLLVAPFALMKLWSSVAYPLGYSVFSFSAIALVIDTFRGKVKMSFQERMAYLLYFPKMMAGPIISPKCFVDSLRNTSTKQVQAYHGFKLLIIGGFIKTVFVGQTLSVGADYHGLNQALEILIFGFRFYLDFFSYCLMAMGLSAIIGIELPVNFNEPYKSCSFKDFWKRWNITLSQWLKEYIYIPLGGNRKGRLRTNLNVFITFSVSALWHGITLPFFIWGWIHVILVIIEKLLLWASIQVKLLKVLYAIMVVAIAIMLWQCFICEDVMELLASYQSILGPATIDKDLLLTLIVVCLFVILVDNSHVSHWIYNHAEAHRAIIFEATCLALLLTATILYPVQMSFNFFYFRF